MIYPTTNKQCVFITLLATTPCFGMQHPKHPITDTALLSHIDQMQKVRGIRWELKADIIEVLGYSEAEAAAQVQRLLTYQDPRAQLVAELVQLPEKSLARLPKFLDESGTSHPSPLEQQVIKELRLRTDAERKKLEGAFLTLFCATLFSGCTFLLWFFSVKI